MKVILSYLLYLRMRAKKILGSWYGIVIVGVLILSYVTFDIAYNLSSPFWFVIAGVLLLLVVVANITEMVFDNIRQEHLLWYRKGNDHE